MQNLCISLGSVLNAALWNPSSSPLSDFFLPISDYILLFKRSCIFACIQTLPMPHTNFLSKLLPFDQSCVCCFCVKEEKNKNIFIFLYIHKETLKGCSGNSSGYWEGTTGITRRRRQRQIFQFMLFKNFEPGQYIANSER